MVRHAAELLRHDPGLATGELAARLSISERQLRRRFVAQVGYGPKRFARIMRLHRLLHLGRRHPEATLGWLAAAAAYADQAHLAHDCHELAGRTPTALLAQRSTVVTRERAA
jgi:transcriptional regulator GlxA family with amidase domain